MTTKTLNGKTILVVSPEKRKLIDTIYHLTGNDCKKETPCDCFMPMCRFNKKCFVVELENNKWKNKNIRLKSLIKNIRSNSNKLKGRRNPYNLGSGVHEIASTLSGCNVYEHELIKGSRWAINALRRATTLNQINRIFDERHKEIHGKSLLWHYDNKYKNIPRRQRE